MDSPALEDPAAGRAGHLLVMLPCFAQERRSFSFTPGFSRVIESDRRGKTGFAKNSLSN